MIGLDEFVTAGALVGPLVDALPEQRTHRQAVLNREPHLQVRQALRRAIWGRDGGRCWICGMDAERPVVDHVRPRSSWPVEDLALADRSDNLRLACWTCNEDKSNFDYLGGDCPLGITDACLRCTSSERTDAPTVRCYCMRCGMGGVVWSELSFLGIEDA